MRIRFLMLVYDTSYVAVCQGFLPNNCMFFTQSLPVVVENAVKHVFVVVVQHVSRDNQHHFDASKIVQNCINQCAKTASKQCKNFSQKIVVNLLTTSNTFGIISKLMTVARVCDLGM